VLFAAITTHIHANPATNSSRPIPFPDSVRPMPIDTPEAHRLPMIAGFFQFGGSFFTSGKIMK